MDDNDVAKLAQNILFLQDNGNLIVYDQNITIKKKLSNGYNKPIWRISCNGRDLTKCSNFRVFYKCITCDAETSVKINLFYRKLIKNLKGCCCCCNYDISKRTIQRSTWTEKAQGLTKDRLLTSKLTCSDLIQQSLFEFEKHDSDFQDNYFRKFLTKDEFERIKKKIVTVNGIPAIDLNVITYEPIVKVNNQYKFYPALYDTKADKLLKIHQLKMECECCNTVFPAKSLEVHKNKYKVLCSCCSFVNNTFKIRKYKLKNHSTINYKSKIELNFIKHLEKLDVNVVNGPSLPYFWNNSLRTYSVDFLLPDYKILVEIKDNHIWHKEQVQSGKWAAKEDAARCYAKTNEYEFVILYPYTYYQFIKHLTKI